MRFNFESDFLSSPLFSLVLQNVIAAEDDNDDDDGA